VVLYAKSGRNSLLGVAAFCFMEGNVGSEVEVITNPIVNSWLTSLTTTGLVILALTVILFALAKFGVFNKFMDLAIERKKLSTSFNKDVLEKINDSISKLLANDEATKARMDDFERSLNDIKLEQFKKSIFDRKLLLIDRMAAGIRYMLEDGNSSTKDFLLNTLCFEDLETWNGLCKAMKATQYWRYEKDRPANWESQIEDKKEAS